MQQEQIQRKKFERPERTDKEYVSIVRIMQTDIPGNKKLIAGLTYIKGVSWAVSNAVCKILELNRNKRITELEPSEINKITGFLKNPKLPSFLVNRRRDFESGKDYHLIISELDMKKEFDIRRLMKIRTYRGLRHALGQPTRGQRTRSHFRKKGKTRAIGVVKSKEASAKSASKTERKK